MFTLTCLEFRSFYKDFLSAVFSGIGVMRVKAGTQIYFISVADYAMIEHYRLTLCEALQERMYIDFHYGESEYVKIYFSDVR